MNKTGDWPSQGIMFLLTTDSDGSDVKLSNMAQFSIDLVYMDLRVMINTERPDLVQHFHIAARALLDINLIRFRYIARLSHWGGGEEEGILLVQIISTCLRCAGRNGGEVYQHPVQWTLFSGILRKQKKTVCSFQAQIFNPKPMKKFSWL
jgi:hypothetical protein